MSSETLRVALDKPVPVHFPNLPKQPTGPDVLVAIAAYMDRMDDEHEKRHGIRANRDVQAWVREWAGELTAALLGDAGAPKNGFKTDAAAIEAACRKWLDTNQYGAQIAAERELRRALGDVEAPDTEREPQNAD